MATWLSDGFCVAVLVSLHIQCQPVPPNYQFLLLTAGDRAQGDFGP